MFNKKNKKIISIIPARSGSKGLRDKNIKKINDIHLLGYSIITSLDSKLISETYVSTDSLKYKKIANSYGAKVPFIRPSNISTSNSTDYQVISHAINFFEEKKLDFEYIVFLRPTTPQRDVKIINKAIKKFINSKYESLRSVHEMSETSFKSFKKRNDKLVTLLDKDKDKDFDYFNQPRQKFPKTFVGNGYIDIFKKSFIKKNQKLYGKNVMAFETNHVAEIDNINDFKYIKYLMES